MKKHLHARILNYGHLATELSLLSDKHLESLIETASHMGTSIGGTSFLLTINNAPIFIKKIRLSNIETQPQNTMSTRNIFQLPLYYQYGVGSAGFGAWRELAAHAMTTNWVLTNECEHFPLMYHYRILSSPKRLATDDDLAKIESDILYWEGSSAIRSRLLASQEAIADIVLFLEYFPSNLYNWLEKYIQTIDTAKMSNIEQELLQTIDFMKSHGFLHMDSHFWNLLTDGDHIYFSDFGLALSSKFELGKPEIEFFEKNQNYDKYSAITNFLHSIITGLYGQDDWIKRLKECLNNKNNLPRTLQSIIKRYAPIAISMDEFYTKLRFESKNTPLPVNQLNELLTKANKHANIF